MVELDAQPSQFCWLFCPLTENYIYCYHMTTFIQYTGSYTTWYQICLETTDNGSSRIFLIF